MKGVRSALLLSCLSQLCLLLKHVARF